MRLKYLVCNKSTIFTLLLFSYLCFQYELCLARTFKAERSVLVGGFWEAGLVGVLVEGPDPQQAASTLRQGDVHGVPDAAVRQPAIVAAAKPRPPGCKQLARGRQHGVVLLTLRLRLLPGDLLGDGGRIEDFTCTQMTGDSDGWVCNFRPMKVVSVSFELFSQGSVHKVFHIQLQRQMIL